VRDGLGLGEGDKTATTPWVRWALVVAALVLIILPRLWARLVWPDVVVAVLVVLAGWAAWKEYGEANKPTKEVIPAMVAFTLPHELLVAEEIDPDKDAIVVVVAPKTAKEGEPVEYESTRYEAKLPDGSESGGDQDLVVAIERGQKDTGIVSFSANLAAATVVYVFPAE